MVRLKDRVTCPPEGFFHVEQGVAWDSRRACPESKWDFKVLTKAVVMMRLANPQLGLPTDKETVANELDRENAVRISAIPNAKHFLIFDTPPSFVHYAGGPAQIIPPGSDRANISAIICTHHQTEEVLNQCLQAVLPQVHEVILVCDQASILPELRDYPTLRIVQVPASNVGYGRKANFGSRFASNYLLWLLNDDVFPDPGCSANLRITMMQNETIGMVGHELRYPNGTLQHGGTGRPLTVHTVGFPHLDTGRMQATISEATEMEAVTGASVLIRHPAFMQAGMFHESYFLYLEDSDLCLSMRKIGWKVYYTPHAKAIHLEHQTTGRTADLDQHIQHSVDIFTSRWGWYFDKNRNTLGLGVFA